MRKVKFLALLPVIYSVAFLSFGVRPVSAEEALTHIYGSMVGQLATNPVVVQAPLGTTVVRGNTLVNFGNVVRVGDESASMLEVREPVVGGRIIYRDNRVFNLGNIVHKGGDGSASMTTLKQEPWQHSSIVQSVNNVSVNRGTIRGIK